MFRYFVKCKLWKMKRNISPNMHLSQTVLDSLNTVIYA